MIMIKRAIETECDDVIVTTINNKGVKMKKVKMSKL